MVINQYLQNSLVAVKRAIPVVTWMRWANYWIRKLARTSHRIQFLAEWAVDNPEYFDHNLDMYYSWFHSRESFPAERGVFSSLAITKNSRVLELCCGDGFNTYHFYSLRASHVLAIDFDHEAIRWARRNYKAPNIIYQIGDIRIDIPIGPFDNIVWDAAIEHFTETEIVNLMSKIKSVLTPIGSLSGYTIVEPDNGGKHLHQHEYEFHSKEDLARFLTPYFRNVQIHETVFPSRRNLYFFASDSQLPFERESSLTIRS
jgi:SAM-dependent methyltransferase